MCDAHAVLVPYGKLCASSLRSAFEADPKQRLQIQLKRAARPGQPDRLNEVPIYAHIRVSALWILPCLTPLALALCFILDSLPESSRISSLGNGIVRVQKALERRLSGLRQETVDFRGRRDALEIVYMKFFAFNGWVLRSCA